MRIVSDVGRSKVKHSCKGLDQGISGRQNKRRRPLDGAKKLTQVE